MAAHIARTHSGLRGFTCPNRFGMRQFYEMRTRQKAKSTVTGERTLLARDRAVEDWLRETVAPAYDEL